MKAVLISIHPKWCELIASGKKTVEVRKTRPKIETPFKCYIYETKGKCKDMLTRRDSNGEKVFTYNNGIGRVIGEFVCDRIYKTRIIPEFKEIGYDLNDYEIKETCITREQLRAYGKDKHLYGWHISNLKIYDKPRELGEFRKPCRFEGKDAICNLFCHHCKYDGGLTFDCDRHLTKPPQSWCHVES